MNKNFQLLKEFLVFLLNYVKFVYNFFTLTFLITILSLISDYINFPKLYFYFLFIIIYLIVHSCKIHGYKVPLVNSIKKQVLYLIFIIPIAFVCLYLLDISIIETIYCENSDSEDSDTEGNSEDKKGKRVARKSSNEIPTTLLGQAYSLINKGMDTVNNATNLGHKTVDVVREIGIKSLEIAEKSVDSLTDNLKENIDGIAPVLGGVSVGKQVIQTFSHKAPVISVTAGALGTGVTVLAIGSAKAAYENFNKNDKINTQLEEVKTSEDSPNPKDVLDKGSDSPINSPINSPCESPIHSPSDSDTDSPSETGGGFINSPLENEIPLVSLLENILMLNILELGIISSLMYIILRGYLNPKLKILILKLLRYVVKNKDELFNKEEKINNIFNNLAKHSNYAIVLLITLLIILKFTTLYFMFNLTENIDSYVNVYNYLTKNSFYLLLSYSNKNFQTKKKQKRNFSNSPPLKKLQRKYSTILDSSRLNNVKIPFPNNRNISTNNNHKLPISSISYNIDSPIFRKLLSLLSSNANKKEVQLQIEQLILNQALEIAKTKLSRQGESPDHNHINKSITLKLVETKPRLEKLINNYKSNLLLMDSNYLV